MTLHEIVYGILIWAAYECGRYRPLDRAHDHIEARLLRTDTYRHKWRTAWLIAGYTILRPSWVWRAWQRRNDTDEMPPAPKLNPNWPGPAPDDFGEAP